MKRVAVPALLASAVLLCVAAAAWTAAGRTVTSAMTAQARIASELLDAHASANESFARSLLRPGLRVHVVDAASGSVIDAGGGGVVTHPLPGGVGAPPGFPLPGNGPPDDPLGAGPAGDALRRDPLPTRPARPSPLAMLALNLLRVPPIRIERGDVVVEIAPDGAELGTWLLCDVVAFACGTVAVVAVASARGMRLARAERHALEARMIERREAADRYQRFLAEIGHELRTPLTVMTGYVDILRGRDSLEPLDERIVDGMYAETSRMRTLVEKMMTLARLESHVSVPRLLDVSGAVAEAAGILRRRYPEREVRIEADEHASIVIDADDYAAALGNILENAVKYAPRSPIAISVTVRDGVVTTSVADEGPGIATGERDAIFERFYRGHATGEGLGLGLAIVKRITERWNGSVTCESDAGRTVFGLRFPIADEETYEIAR